MVSNSRAEINTSRVATARMVGLISSRSPREHLARDGALLRASEEEHHYDFVKGGDEGQRGRRR